MHPHKMFIFVALRERERELATIASICELLVLFSYAIVVFASRCHRLNMCGSRGGDWESRPTSGQSQSCRFP